MKTATAVLIIVLVLILLFFLGGCKLKCDNQESSEGMRRLASSHTIADNAYGYTMFPGYKLAQTRDFGVAGRGELQGEDANCTGWGPNRRCKEGMTMGNGPKPQKFVPYGRCDVRCAGYADKKKCISACKKARAAIMELNYLGGQHSKVCSSTSDCDSMELCVQAGPYTGGKGGYCMNWLEPGVPRSDTEGFTRGRSQMPRFARTGQHSSTSSPPCPPGHYWNFDEHACQSIFQGSSSAKGVWSGKPYPQPGVVIPGTTLPSFGTGTSTPFDYLPNFPVKLLPNN